VHIGGEQFVLAGDLLDALQATLLGFENKAVFPVKIDPSVRVAVVFVFLHSAFEDVIVMFVRGVSGIGRRQSERCDQLVEEQRVICAFLAAFTALPTPDEGFYGLLAFDFPH
jgi:hypothetical protein